MPVRETQLLLDRAAGVEFRSFCGPFATWRPVAPFDVLRVGLTENWRRELRVVLRQ